MNKDANGRFDMSNYNIDNVTSLEKAVTVIEAYFLNPFSNYINSDFDGSRFNSNPKSFTMSYMYANIPWFLTCIRVFLKVCDELDKAKELNEYFRKTVLKHLKDNVLKELQNKDDEMLVKLYVKQWKRFTIFTHYMRKLFSYLVSEIWF